MFDKFPFTNAHELNLDWILRILNKLKGGTKDQVLTRLSNKPFDFGWKTMSGGGGGGGTTDYNELGNKPSINGVTLEGNKTSAQLNIPVGPELANTMPLMDGTPQIGNSSRAAKADHVHPSDTSKADIATVRAEINRQLNQYDPAEADYDPPYAAGTLGYAIENAAIAPEDIQDAVDNYLDDHPTITGTFTNAAKNALLDLLDKVAYIDGNGQTYLDALRSELFATTVLSISAVFTQGATVIYDTDTLDSLKSMLVVTATYSDSSTEVINASDYTLSGTLTVGTSTITVSYENITDTFSVAVTAWDFSWSYTDGLLESEQYWIVSTASTGSSTMLSDGEKIIGGSSSYRQLYPKDAPYQYMADGYGVMELVLYGSWPDGTTPHLVVNTGNSAGTRRLNVIVYQNKWRIRTSSTSANCPIIGDAGSDTTYKVRLVLNGTTGNIYINDVLVAENVDTSTMYSGGANSITSNNNTGYAVLQAVRLKNGSV